MTLFCKLSQYLPIEIISAETETEAGRSLENDIESTSAPEQQPSSLTENQETGAERRPTITTRVLRRPKSNKTGKKCSRPRTNIKEPNRFERILRSRLQKYQTGMRFFFQISLTRR